VNIPVGMFDFQESLCQCSSHKTSGPNLVTCLKRISMFEWCVDVKHEPNNYVYKRVWTKCKEMCLPFQ
jgi:hypothetical protein